MPPSQKGTLTFCSEFNSALEGFYSDRAEKVVAEQWFEEHDYGSGDVDDDPSTWH